MRFPIFRVAAIVLLLLVVILTGCTSRPAVIAKQAAETTCDDREGRWAYGKTIGEANLTISPRIGLHPQAGAIALTLMSYINKPFQENTWFLIQNDMHEVGAFDSNGEADSMMSMFLGPIGECEAVSLHVVVHLRNESRDTVTGYVTQSQKILMYEQRG